MLMRLANAEEYNYLTSDQFVDSCGNDIVFVDFLPDGLNSPHFMGETYHNDQKFFGVFLFKSHPHALGWENDGEWKIKPVIVYFTGKDDTIACFKRFAHESDAMSWIDSLYPVLSVEPDWKTTTS
jgi:hypothetical protein